ncbi:hypothetical protein UUU_02960 (plasmid) [Klebsiella pneumoniae subsp. pneumoniae DSM 30104 = JCM 1662 = NBRC 14940]|nr:hypothetical protein UUU_02960 [Klebsiella pneumoniae subsp. pneumoniae DSM 30104 = JCM 1662 = NBRC 14940]
MESLPPEKDKQTEENVSNNHSIRRMAAHRTFLPVRIFSAEKSLFIPPPQIALYTPENSRNIFSEQTQRVTF